MSPLGQSTFPTCLGKLAEDRSLGLVGTAFKEGTNPPYDYRYVNIEHVTGCCQLFRRECFEEIGGYVPVKGGCIDHIAVITRKNEGLEDQNIYRYCLSAQPGDGHG